MLLYVIVTVSRGTYLDRSKHEAQICKQCPKHVEELHV